MEKGGRQEETEIEMTGRKKGQKEKRLEEWRDAKRKKKKKKSVDFRHRIPPACLVSDK